MASNICWIFPRTDPRDGLRVVAQIAPVRRMADGLQLFGGIDQSAVI